MNHHANKTDIVVIGGGMTGLTAAAELKQSGLQVLVIDKARGVGGRLANRRFDGAVFDHGAQFMTARDDRFLSLVEKWQDKGIVKEWYRDNLSGSGIHPRFRGKPAMSAIAKELAQDLNPLLFSQVTSINLDGDNDSPSPSVAYNFRCRGSRHFRENQKSS
jgi:renalase